MPWVALPIVWLREGRWLALGLVGAPASRCALVLAASGRDRAFPDEDPDRPDDPGDAGIRARRTAPAPTPRPGRARAAVAVRRRPARPVRRSRGGLGAGPARRRPGHARPRRGSRTRPPAPRAWPRRPTSPARAPRRPSRPAFWYRMDETSSTTTTATDSSGNGRTGVYGSGGKTTTTNQGLRPRHRPGDDLQRLQRLPQLAGRAPAGCPASSPCRSGSAPTTRSGGKLIGFGSAQTGASGTYDRHVYMANSGRLYFGVYANAVRTVSSASAYNDGALAPRDGLLVLRGHAALRRRHPGRDRPGHDDRGARDRRPTSGWPTTTSTTGTTTPTSRYFAGTLDDAAYFPSALTAAQVRTLYESGTS